ncbi:MAG: hypothetical protein H0U21_09065 [Acidimicrobiia bacterium]|nr:hypothetical protein [Acidimicrobiia bacterium]
MFEDFPSVLTVDQMGDALQIGRTRAYALTAEWERTHGKSGMPFFWCGHQKRITRSALLWYVEQCWAQNPPAA